MSQEPTTDIEVEGPADSIGEGLGSAMGSATPHPPATVRTLRQAMRRARQDDAERVTVQSDQRLARLCRLEMLEEALRLLIAQIPADVDLFDIGLMPGSTPRLFIDMIGFIEMGHNARVYSFAQDTRHGRVQLAESADIDTIIDAVTDYIARRMLERDKALASDSITRPGRGSRRDARGGPAAPAAPSPLATPRHETPRREVPRREVPRREAGSKRSRLGWFGVAFAFAIDVLGSIAFFTLLAGIGWLIWNRLHGQV